MLQEAMTQTLEHQSRLLQALVFQGVPHMLYNSPFEACIWSGKHCLVAPCMLSSGLSPDLSCAVSLILIAIIGTSDRPCWLAEACEIHLLSHTQLPAAGFDSLEGVEDLV